MGTLFYKILADLVVFIHFLWVLFLIFGVFLGVKSKLARATHMSGLIFALVIQVFNVYCPLTYLEVWLRAMHKLDVSYTGSFIIHYMEKILYVESSRTIIFIVTLLLCGLTAFVYFRKKNK